MYQDSTSFTQTLVNVVLNKNILKFYREFCRSTFYKNTIYQLLIEKLAQINIKTFNPTLTIDKQLLYQALLHILGTDSVQNLSKNINNWQAIVTIARKISSDEFTNTTINKSTKNYFMHILDAFNVTLTAADCYNHGNIIYEKNQHHSLKNFEKTFVFFLCAKAKFAQYKTMLLNLAGYDFAHHEVDFLSKKELSNTYLLGAQFFGLTLNKADFSHSDIRYGNFEYAAFTQTKLMYCDMRFTIFKDDQSRFAATQFHFANCSGANWQKICLNGAIFVNTNMKRANLKGTVIDTHMEKTNLMYENLEDVDFGENVLINVNLAECITNSKTNFSHVVEVDLPTILKATEGLTKITPCSNQLIHRYITSLAQIVEKKQFAKQITQYDMLLQSYLKYTKENDKYSEFLDILLTSDNMSQKHVKMISHNCRDQLCAALLRKVKSMGNVKDSISLLENILTKDNNVPGRIFKEHTAKTYTIVKAGVFKTETNSIKEIRKALQKLIAASKEKVVEMTTFKKL